VRIELNGEPAELPEKATVTDAVTAAGADGARRGVAVALDGEVIARAGWESTPLREGQTVEVVRAVQGG
jgi:sulfur carrier protein